MLALDSAIWTGTISSKSTRGDHVHTNATRPEVAGEVKGQSGHAGLGDSVVDRLSLHGVLVVPAPGNGSVDQQPEQYNAKLICGQEKYSRRSYMRSSRPTIPAMLPWPRRMDAALVNSLHCAIQPTAARVIAHCLQGMQADSQC